MEVDHVVPESMGGATVEANLCLTCVSCNSHKNDAQIAIDPDGGEEVALFNPRTQTWSDHFRWSDDGTYLIGLTPSGRATVSRLQINREMAIRARELWVKAGWHPPKDL
jgi:hypothetical protein